MLVEGQLFDNTYRLLRRIGEGGMGVVYEATHARLAGRYAIKVLLRTLSDNAEALERFCREVKITSALQHPNVVAVIDYNTAADGTEYLVMEYLDGESLGQRLFREGPLPLDQVIGIVEQIAAGLAAAHARGVVHRDLKPDNVFLVRVEGREAESVKILDFGISKVKGSIWGVQAPEGGLCGTPQYMSPEQVGGRMPEVDAATDQFALAVMTYEMLTGRNPFQGDTVGAVFAQVLNGIPAPTGVGRDVDLVLLRALAKTNAERFPGITDFSDALTATATERARKIQHVATLAYAAQKIASLKITRGSRRRSWGLTLLATGVASVSMSFALGWNTRRHLSPADSHSASAATASPDVAPVVFPAAAVAAVPVAVVAQGLDLQAAPPLAAPSVAVPAEKISPDPAPSRPRRHHSSPNANGPRATRVQTGPRLSAAEPRLMASPRPADDDAILPLDELNANAP